MSEKQKLVTSKNNSLRKLLDEVEAEFEDDGGASSLRNPLHNHLQMLQTTPRKHSIACRACANLD